MSTTMHFGPEWMRTKHVSRPQAPPSPPPANSGLSTYSALVSPSPLFSERSDDAHPFRYSKDELLKIYQEGAGKGGLGLEVERWDGVVREVWTEPVALRELTEAEKKRFAGSLNSELRRRPSQSTEYLSPLAISGVERPRLTLNPSNTNSPLRERFGSVKRKDIASSPDASLHTLSRKPSIPAMQSPLSSSRPRVGYTPSFDGVLNNGDSWAARRRSSESSLKFGNTPAQEDMEIQRDMQSYGIREEKEDNASLGLDAPHMPSEGQRQYKEVTGGISGAHSVAAIDLASIEWSYKDPTGQVQGPFRADLMQKWYNDGYFSTDLPMKRVLYDSQWITVEELVQRSKGGNIFMTFPFAFSQESLNNIPSIERRLSHHEPFEPTPIRSVLSSNIESDFTSASLPSKFASSLEVAYVGDKISYLENDPPGQFANIGAHEHIYSSDGNDFHASSINPSPSGNFQTEEDLNYNGFEYNAPHDPWNNRSNLSPSAFRKPASDEHLLLNVDQSQRLLGSPHIETWEPIDLKPIDYHPYDVPGPHSPFRRERYVSTDQVSDPTQSLGSLGLQSLSMESPKTQTSSAIPFNPPTISAEASWNKTSDSLLDLVPSYSANQPFASDSRSRQRSQAPLVSLHDRSISDQDSPWRTVPTLPNLTSKISPQDDQGHKLPESQLASDLLHHSKTMELSSEALKKGNNTAPQGTYLQSESSPSVRETSTNIGNHKVAWVKEEEGRKKSGVIVSVSLREIQEAEVKKLDIRKTMEREKEKSARSTELKEDLPVFTTTWGLPTSQTGTRAAAREMSISPSESPATAPVWTASSKQSIFKKSMKEIQEEEEAQKKLIFREVIPPTVTKRAYAETTTKNVLVPSPSTASYQNAWTTVGPSGKAVINTVLPRSPPKAPATFATASTSVSAPKPSLTSTPKFSSTSTLMGKQATKLEFASEAPSHEFLKWLSESLKGLNSSVNVEEIVSMLLSFPLDPDTSTIEIISDTIYSNSTTLDGRRFASEFILKRKADVVEQTKSGASSGKVTLKPISIADVVKAAPKPAPSEWGFKVVNKKKKGGRS